MCEFNVYLTELNSEKRTLLCKGISIAITKDDSVVLMDIIGNSQIIQDVIISEVNTIKQELLLIKINVS